MYKRYLLLILFFLFYLLSYSQTDSIITNDNNILVGKIKKLKEGVVTMSTIYSESDFKIEWLKVKTMSSKKKYRIILNNGGRFYGIIKIDTSGNKVLVIDKEKGTLVMPTYNIVDFEEIKKGSLLDVLKLSLDFGYSFTSANEMHQLNGDINTSYNKEKWGFSAFFNTVQNAQRNVSPTKRNNGGFGIKYFFHYGLFASIDANYYSNNEQQLNLRSNYSLGFGKYIVRTNQVYFNVFLGSAFSVEDYVDAVNDKQSIEGKFGTEFHWFYFNHINLFSSVYMFPSFTERGRLRTIINVNIKYDITTDFYLKTSVDYNYDTKPIADIRPYDYVFTFGIGWDL